MSGVRDIQRGLTSLASIKQALAKATPMAIVADVARDAAEFLTTKVREEYDSGQTVFDEPRPLGVEGNKLSLIGGGPLPKYGPYAKKKPHRSRGINAPRGSGKAKTGAHVRDTLGFVANGSIVRARLGQKHARYLIGKYKILPHEGAQLPPAWVLGVRGIFQRHLGTYFASRGWGLS